MKAQPVIMKFGLLELLFLIVFPMSTYAFEVDGIAYSIESDSMVAVTSRNGKYSGTIIIPSEVDYQGTIYTVGSIYAMAFYECSNLTAITIPGTVTQIGVSAFRGCKNLTGISVPNMVESIPESCFNSCSNLQYIKLPEGLKSIGKEAFHDCSSLNSIEFPSGLQEIGEYAFAGCLKLNNITLPASIENIPAGCFNGCRNLTNVELKNGIKRIDSFAFYTLSEISIHFPPSIEYIGASALYSGGFVLYRGNIQLGKQNSNVNIVVLDTAFPTIIEKGDAHLYLVNKASFLSSNNYSTSNVTSIGEYGEDGGEFVFWYDGTSQPLIKGWLNSYSTLQNMGIEWYCPNFDVKDAGYYSGNANIEAKHNDWTNSFTISYAFEILKAELMVHVNNCERIFGDENPQFTFEVNGYKGNDNTENAISNIIFNTSATISSDVGEYAIRFSAESNNYDIKATDGILKVIPSPLIVKVNDASREYGESNPDFSMSVEGFKLNDSIVSAFSLMPDISTEANELSDCGIYPIIVSGGTAKNYIITEYQNGKLTIVKAPLVLTANNKSRLYYEDNPEFDYTLSGLKNNDDGTCINTNPAYTCAANKTSDCGEYDIIPSNAQSKNYNISYQNGTLTITKAPLTLKALDLTREYGDTNPILTYEAIGLKGDDTALKAMTEEPTLTTTADEQSGVGQYPITISGGDSKNYTLNYKSGVMTIIKAPLTIIAENAERIYGESNPAFNRSYIGFKLNDTEAKAFSTLPRVNCTATKTSDVGEYAIIIEGGVSRNYEVSQYQNGILTIVKAPLVLTANNKTRLYYEDNPEFDYTLSGLKNGDTKSCLAIAPSYTCTAKVASDAGEYPIVPSNADAKNYSIKYNNGTLTVSQRPLTAFVGEYTRKYNEENPFFTVNYTGFVNGENASSLLRQTTALCEATKTSDVGSYAIIPTGGEAVNYIITKYTNGTLTIEKANQTISWDQDLSNIEINSQVALTATSDSGLPVTYEMSPNNVATLYDNAGTWYLDCYGSGAVSVRATQNGDKNYNPASIIAKTLVVSGGSSDPTTPPIYLNVETAGTLPNLIAENRKYQIKNLRLTGYLNGTDINYIREMAGCDSNGNTTAGVLETLDVSGCTIVAGGRNYYMSYHTSDYKVSKYMFYKCNTLISLSLPENTLSLGSYALAECDRLSVISLSNTITSFGPYSFSNDIGLIRIPMPNSLESIGDKAFYGCKRLTALTIPENVSSIGVDILENCDNISEINVVIGNLHYASCDGVLYTKNLDKLLLFPANYADSEFVVTEGVSEIEKHAFFNAKKLTDLVLPSSLTKIGEDAFIGCVNLNSLHVLALNPPVCQNDCFESVSKTRCELRVPRGCYSYYWVAPVWSEFNNLIESEYSGIVEIPNDEVSVTLVNNSIYINGLPANVHIYIYRTDGSLMYHTITDGTKLYYQPNTSGVYLVVIANKTYKLLVK